MNKVEAARYIIEGNGYCESLRCEDCFLDTELCVRLDKVEEAEAFLSACKMMKSNKYESDKIPMALKNIDGKTWVCMENLSEDTRDCIEHIILLECRSLKNEVL